MSAELRPGLIHHPGFLDEAARMRLAGEVASVLAASPPFTPRMPRTGKPFSVRMGNAGRLGWVSDEGGYRYQPTHPETGEPLVERVIEREEIYDGPHAHLAPDLTVLLRDWRYRTIGLHDFTTNKLISPAFGPTKWMPSRCN